MLTKKMPYAQFILLDLQMISSDRLKVITDHLKHLIATCLSGSDHGSQIADGDVEIEMLDKDQCRQETGSVYDVQCIIHAKYFPSLASRLDGRKQYLASQICQVPEFRNQKGLLQITLTLSSSIEFGV